MSNYYFHFVTLNFQILLECSDICIKLIWVLIKYVMVMTYIWLGRSWIFLNIKVLWFYMCLHLSYVGFHCVFLMVVKWDFTRRDQPGNPGGISGSGPVSLVSEL